ncbi:ABC transporter permease [Pseudovibrio exalbescens]|uniref:ABC transporter permease n=1 Tax=Pseudovibrio exalbescens TaxID=197461 RepID=UPI0023651D6A|nr:ABC transporter permease [Pseudovibrio exalbescens]MDD7911622.1 ABC transporter permease [Pseudovibrio exalbescens]
MENVLLIQTRVVGALVLRETRTTFGNSQLGYFWAIANPALGIAVLVGLFSMIGRVPPYGDSLALFFATGFLTFELYKKLSSSLMSVFDSTRGLLSYPLVVEIDVVLARALLIVATYLFIMLIFYGSLIVLGLASYPRNADQIAMAVLATSLLGIGAGLVNAVIMRLWATWKQIEGILSKPLFFISGIFFIPSAFPSSLVDLISWNPVLHCIEWVREGYYPNYNSVVLDKPYLLSITLVLLLVGLGAERLYRKKRI